jgi:hypothetical protein
MIEDLDDNGNNYQEDSQNQDDLDNNQNIQLNPNRKKVLPNINNNNNNDSFGNNDFNQNENENNQMNQPMTNFYYDKDRNVTEEISNRTVGILNKFVQYIGKYFNVELSDLKLKLKGALIPFNKSFYQSIEVNADLYGPFWTFTTIIFLIALIVNISSYAHCEDKTKFVYNYNHVPHAIFIIYGFGFGAPFLLWIISKFLFRIDIDLLINMCVYGYSYVILVPILILCIIPYRLISTLALLYFLIHSCVFLFYNMYLIIQQKAPKSKYFVLGLLGGVQFILFLLLKFYFF